MKPAYKKLAAWVALIVVFLAIWQALAPSRPGPSEPFDLGAWLLSALPSMLPALVICGGLLALVLRGRRVNAASARHQAALQASTAHLEAGRYEEAEQAVESLSRSRLPQFRRAYHAQRAEIAARRGDRAEATARLDEAMTAPVGRWYRGAQEGVVRAARGLRAFLRASAGDEAGAREDVATLRADAQATPAQLARAALAEAMLLDKAGDRAALGELLSRHRALILAAAPARERALLRAYEAMLESSPASVYRQQGDREAPGEDAAEIAAWVAWHAPSAAPFVRTGTAAAAGATGRGIKAEAPSDEARRKVEASRPKGAKDPRSLKAFALRVVLILAFLAGWVWFGVSVAPLPEWLLIAVVGLGMGAWVVRKVRRANREARRIAGASRAISVGDLEGAAAALDFEPSFPNHRAQAAHFQAKIALRRGEMGEALARCDRAFVVLAQIQGGKVTPPAAPPKGQKPGWDFARVVAADRAYALAGLGRGDEAWAEIAWAQGFPDAFPIHRVALLTRLLADDFAGAARVFEKRDAAMLLPAHDELLGEMARFAGRPAARSVAEAARLRAELRRDPELTKWIEAVTPGLTAAFERAAAETEAAGAGRAPTAGVSEA